MSIWLQIILSVFGTLGTVLLGAIATNIKNISDKQNSLTTTQEVLIEKTKRIENDIAELKDLKDDILTGRIGLTHYTKRHD